MRRFVRKMVLVFSLFLFLNSNVFAQGYGYPAPSQGGGTGACLSTWGGCWTGASNKAYRMTLVGLDGKRVPGTKSVDFAGLEFYNCEGSRKNICDFKNYSPIGGYYDNTGKYIARYGYKFSKKHNDYMVATESDPLELVYLNKLGDFKSQYSVNNLFVGDNGELINDPRHGYVYSDYKYLGEAAKKENGDKPISFYDLFLHYCGYLSDEDIYSNDADPTIKNSTIIVEPTYAVYFYSNDSKVCGSSCGTIYRYGTVTELAQFMLDHPGKGLDWGVSKALRQNVALCVNSKDVNENLTHFEAIKTGINTCQNSINYYDVTLDKLVDSEKAYGMNIAIVPGKNECALGTCEGEDYSGYSLNWCSRTEGSVEKNGASSVVSVEPNVVTSETTTITTPIITTHTDVSDEMTDGNKITLGATDFTFDLGGLYSDYFKISGGDDAQSAYCFDSVTYDFVDFSNDLHGTFNKYTFVNPRPAKVTINRQCLLGLDYTDTKHLDSSSYKNSFIKVNFYDQGYEIYPSDSADNTEFNVSDNNQSGSGKVTYVKPKNLEFYNALFQQVGSDTRVNFEKPVRSKHTFRYATYTLTLNYAVPKDMFFIGEDASKTGGYVTLGNISNAFGYSQSFLSNSILKGTNSATFSSTQCPISYKIDTITAKSNTNITFRVIDLNNPFPGRDGASRMPAVNWLYDENNVYNYISTGRGPLNRRWYDTGETDENGYPIYSYILDAEAMYDYAQPMYTITLTPSTMINIRNYNKTHSYYSMYEYDTTYVKYKDGIESKGKSDSQTLKEQDNSENALKLRCSDEGRECYSEFLRNSAIIPQDEETISGTCFMGRNQAPTSSYNPTIRKEFYSGDSVFLYDQEKVDTYKELIFNTEKDYETGKYKKDLLGVLLYGEAYDADVNFNGLFDSEDIEIMQEYAKVYDSENTESALSPYPGKLINYYSCANKTYKSGGPVKEEE